MATKALQIGKDARQQKGWLRAHKWLLLRRLSQLSVIALFVSGPLLGAWLIKGDMSSSRVLDTIPLTDAFVFLQTLFAMAPVEQTLLIGAAIVTVFYLIAGGRTYCAWVCPINMVTDGAESLRRKLNIKTRINLSRSNRSILLGAILLGSLFTGTLIYELVNPVTMFQRELVFGMGFSWAILFSIFIFDMFFSKRGWCGHLCPMGKFYSLPGKLSLLRVNASKRDQCNDCMECYVVCPEPQVIKPALKGAASETPVILSGDCTNCGQCIDVCAKDVFTLSHRFTTPITEKLESSQREVSL